MINSENQDNDISPLDQIRQVEAEVTRSIAAARDAADTSIREARNQVKHLFEEARLTGRNQGQVQSKEVLSIAEEEARVLISQANHKAEELRLKGKKILSTAVRQACHIIIGVEGGNQDS